ncbi:MAG: hypothetical protein KDC73_05455 [Ignavibacteriae bacterium]|nr:hypothetical protein [Ignavibacteriota bacterium]MCB0724127.1 hypothetical protein [Ignavibacteriota bacterium]MCB9243829.1 hypothetical protein [Ignavibacteriales bacterium]
MKKILFICGSLNQTTMLHRVSKHLEGYDMYFSAYYCDGIEKLATNLGLLNFTVLGGKFKRRTEAYLKNHKLKNDFEGKSHDYDLVVTCSDLVVPKNTRDKNMVLVQEGMTDPENLTYHLVKRFNLPRYFASTSTTGLSNLYTKFCVASEGYKKLFAKKGADESKIVVTGLPNFDHCNDYLNNNFPHKHYVLVCTSDSRETYKYENRKKFIKRVMEIADGKQIIFKLHPNENVPRATREIRKWAPGALVYSVGNTDHMIANCDVLITKFSTVVYVGLALGKEVYSEFPIEELRELTPIQNGGVSSYNIAQVCKELLEGTNDFSKDISKGAKPFNKSYSAAR